MPFINGGHIWIVLILVGVLVIFGPGKLPELGSAVGRTIREFKKSTEGLREEITAKHDTPVATAPVVTTVVPVAPAPTTADPIGTPVAAEPRA